MERERGYNNQSIPSVLRRDGDKSFYHLPYTQEDKDATAILSKACMTQGLENYRCHVPFKGPIIPGRIFCWQPSDPYACEAIEVVEVTDTQVLTRSRQRCPGDIWLDIDYFRRGAVPSRWRNLPGPFTP